ncbi:MAG: formylglycine-generating enzyme family protein [Rhodospirillales bacterium]|nr:MAG: formylglycine-generating enzyme family protein [Rhodospirillales bacterium]
MERLSPSIRVHPCLLSCILYLFSFGALAGEPFKDCDDCPEMVIVPAGSFVMGSQTGHENERPEHKVTIAKSFALGRFEITFDDWQLCVDAKACTRSPDDHQWGKAKRPVMNVTFDDVTQYLTWLSKKTGKRYRLPSEAEWEWAARGGAKTIYPWGDGMEDGLANCRSCGAEPFGGFSSAPVGSYPPNGYGLYDMTGNVWEWVQDCWHPDHTGASKDAKPRGPETQSLPGIPACLARVMKGGAWYYFAPMARPAARARNDSRVLSYVLGFRVAREID